MIGCIYLCARASRASSAPKKVRIGHSKRITPTHAGTDKVTAPNTVAVFIAALHAENDAAANADEHAEAVDDVPDGRNDRQRAVPSGP